MTLPQWHPPSPISRSDEKHPDGILTNIDQALTGAQFEDPNLDKNHLAFEDDSPYPEVRSAVANTDDPEMLVSTLRAWVIGTLWAMVIPGVNQFFFFRFPSIMVTGIVAQLLSFPIGCAAATWVPNWTIFGLRLNPGPFTVKEHVLITWFVVMSTQLIGFSIGGITRRFLVAPPSMIWPINLVNFQALSYFSWVTWIRPDDPTIAALFGTSYDNQQKEYNVTRILTPESTIDLDAYRAYSPLFISTTFAISYGLSFASITATLVHTFLYFRKQIWVQSRRTLSQQPDIHARLMSRYPQVPEWWYLTIFLSMFAIGIISIEVEMPVWAFLLSLAISFTLTIPIGMIQAITNQQITLNVITELVIGYALPGHPVAMMLFKTWGYKTIGQALSFTSDFKLGHYMKVPPRHMFLSQVIATVIAGTTQLGVQAWMFTNIDSTRHYMVHEQEIPTPRLEICQFVSMVNVFCVQSFNRNSPVIFGGTSLLPPASAINYVPWAVVGFIFQYLIRRRHFSWWIKYNYVLSAALDSGVAVSILIIFFTLQFPKNGTIGATTLNTWWGNTVKMVHLEHRSSGD
ncbi:hypothetical protein DXG01_016661 [Tephrocybe rancida]|nr:hypothetical protein DXG01_016661 [Tephrocybe rancida]